MPWHLSNLPPAFPVTLLCRCATLAAAVRDEAQAWVRGIAGVLAEGDAAQIEALRTQASCGVAGAGFSLFGSTHSRSTTSYTKLDWLDRCCT